MRRNALEQIQRNKNFYVYVYRSTLVALIFSLILSCIILVLMFYIYLTEPERDFFATSGVSAPVQLTPLLAPNYSSSALLPPDPSVVESEEKLIPQ